MRCRAHAWDLVLLAFEINGYTDEECKVANYVSNPSTGM